MTCALCAERIKDWRGDDPECAFANEAFSGENWNCATANAIRDIVNEDNENRPGVDFQFCDDQKYATLRVDELELDGALALWVTWYKSRGKTNGMWLMFSDRPPRLPTEQEAIAVIQAFRRRNDE
jgi:hypothetical protein